MTTWRQRHPADRKLLAAAFVLLVAAALLGGVAMLQNRGIAHRQTRDERGQHQDHTAIQVVERHQASTDQRLARVERDVGASHAPRAAKTVTAHHKPSAPVRAAPRAPSPRQTPAVPSPTSLVVAQPAAPAAPGPPLPATPIVVPVLPSPAPIQIGPVSVCGLLPLLRRC